MRFSRIVGIFGIIFGVLWCASLNANAAVIDFDGVTPFQDFAVYSEDGFSLTPNVGSVRVNNAFSASNAAQPSFGFGQNIDSKFTLTNDSQKLFSISSIDLLEATVFPDVFGVTLTGIKQDASIVTQTLKLDGIAGAETFLIGSLFSDLVSLKFGEDISNSFPIDIVQVDNIIARVVPLPPALLLLSTSLAVMGSVGWRRRRMAAAAENLGT